MAETCNGWRYDDMIRIQKANSI